MQINLFFEHLNHTPLKIYDKFFYFNIKRETIYPLARLLSGIIKKWFLARKGFSFIGLILLTLFMFF
ncbi:hypothetical protein ECC07_05655 [Helicobacter pylori]|nr:hypothetical protein [Helicobacter pylori]PUD39920.1 hypothetical protein C2R81_04005 [Helicobacter pylori]PUD72741.1 hypothetical protein C2R69_04010 [Helicobacter pylori]QEF31747.1 hypothetical protein D2C80_00530 [Helicobacter pylori]RVY25272.1 hypothetical protein ECC07_05655 [Helicobacter pylori]